MTKGTVEQLMPIALQHHQAGRLPQAEQLYRQILAQQPNHAEALHLLGVISAQGGRNDVAADLIRRAISIKPNWAQALGNLANALKDNGQLDEAIATYHQAIALGSNQPDAHYNLGNALRAKEKVDEAVASYRQAIALRPNWPQAHSNLGEVLRTLGKLDEAIAACSAAIACNPGYPQAYYNLGVALKDKGEIDEAIAAYRRAIALKPGWLDACYNLGNALQAKGQPDEAIAAYRQAIALDPSFPQAYGNLGNVLKDSGRLDEAIAAYRQAIALEPDFPPTQSNLVLALHYHPAYDAQTIANEYRSWNARHGEPLKKFIQAHLNGRNPERRLRIGYVSADLTGHPVGRFLLPLLAQHDRMQFEVFVYSQVQSPDAMTQRLRSLTDVWRSIVGLSDAQTVELIRQDRIDILVDLSMHTANNRLPVFACKPAPAQVTYLAYCSSTGLQSIDYRLSDPHLDPPGGDESIYSEKTIRLPETFWCYQQTIATPEVGPLPALEQNRITLGCLNSFCKVNEPTLVGWGKILRAIPNSHLVLHAHEGSHRQRLQERLAREGIEPKRVQFAGKLPIEKYFDLYRRIDIALDTFPWAGGTTTCDALWMGVPVVSLAGQTAVGRGGSSILSNVGLPELVAGSQEQYVAIAVKLAGDLPRLSSLRSTLRRRMEQSPLMDAPRFARHVEAAYRQMWRQWCAAPIADTPGRMP